MASGKDALRPLLTLSPDTPNLSAVDLLGFLAALRRHLLALVLCVVAGLLGGVYVSLTPKTYEATARVIVNVPTAEQLSQALAGAQLTAILVNTYGQVVHSSGVAELVAQQLPNLTPAMVESKLTGSVEPGTYIIDITARDGSPKQSQAIANAAANALGTLIGQYQIGKPDRISIAIFERAALPDVPISPRPTVDLSLGLSLGLVAGLALVSLRDALDRTVKTPEQAQMAADAPVLAVVARRPRRLGMSVSPNPSSPLNEAYRELRTALHFHEGESAPRTIVVTGAAHDDGATAAALNLAQAFAISGVRVLLIDADLRNNQLAKSLSIGATGGLSDVLVRGEPLDAHVHPWAAKLDLLPAGTASGRESELVGSQAMVDLITKVADRYDVVILDTPPVLGTIDAVVLAAQVDGTVLVVRNGSTPQHAIADAARRLTAVGARLLGVVVTAMPAKAR